MFNSLKQHWQEYLMEAAGLGLFMISACGFAVVLFHPESPVVAAVNSAVVRRVWMGFAMGGTAVALIYSPWGKQSGAHYNPAVTLTFFRLGKVAAGDAMFYGALQTLGGLAGVFMVVIPLRRWISDPAVNYVATVPGPAGSAVAWLTEFAISAILMSAVLIVSNTPRAAGWTGLVAGMIVAANISLAAPLSGMSMNPARTLASAIPSGVWTAIWIYFTAPPLGMLLAAQCYLWAKGRHAVHCAKLHHQHNKRCIFCESRVARPNRESAEMSTHHRTTAVALEIAQR
jgi:aquaporin Z